MLARVRTLAPLLLAACSSSPRAPEADLPPALALAVEARVQVRIESAPDAPLSAAALAEAVACALEQSTTLDFLVQPPGPGQEPANVKEQDQPTEEPAPAARIALFLERLPGSSSRWRFHAAAERLADGAATNLEAIPSGPDPSALLAGLDAVGRALRRTLGEPLPALLAASQPLGRACTQNPEALLALARARVAAREGRVLQAGEELERALRLDPGCTRARIVLAALLLEGGATEPAQRLLEVARLGLPDLNAVDRHRLERLRLRAAGRPEELKTLGEEFLSSHPGNAEGAFTLGLALNQLGRYQHAEPIWRRLTDRDRSSASACFQLGFAYYGLERYDEAARAWEQLEDRGAQAIQAAFFPALARLAAGEEETARAHLEASLARARDQAALRARLRLLLAARAVLAGSPEQAEHQAAETLGECRADPLPTRPVWSLAARFLLFRRQGAEVERFLAALPLEAEYCPAEIRLAALWLQGLMRAEDPRDAGADQAASRLRENRWIPEAAQIDAVVAAGRGNPAARMFNLKEAVQADSSPWNRYLLAAGLLDEGRRAEAEELLEALVDAGLSLDPGRLDRHPAANPLSAVALVEARRRLQELRGSR